MKNKDVKIIGICGAARAGKDSVAQMMTRMLVDTDNELFQNHVIATEQFAAPIKSMAAMLLDFFGYVTITNQASTAPFVDGDKKEEVLDSIGVSTRTLMQTLGTDWGRDMIHPDLWLNCMEGRIKQFDEAMKHGYDGVFIIITDVRFDNEVAMIKKLGGTIVEVTSTRELDDVVEHKSEGGVSKELIDARIPNNEGFPELDYLVRGYLEDLLDEPLSWTKPTIITIPENPDDEDDRPVSGT